MHISLALMTRFFQLVSERKFAESDRVLERISVRMKKEENNEFNRGYIDALRGIILTNRVSGENYEFFNNLNLNNIQELKRQYKDFSDQSQSKFHADYDRGYFSALSDYMRIIISTK